VSAAAARAELAAIGGDLARLSDGWRAQALLGAPPPEQVSFADLARAPDWLRQPREDLNQVALSAGLIAMAPVLSASIDGAWLGELAAVAGEPALDCAIAVAGRVPGGGLPPLPAGRLAALGFDLLRAALPRALRRYLAWAPAGTLSIEPALAVFCLTEARR
jgi:hypothetical protein